MMSKPFPAAVWFEIPTDNFERAIAFYETLLTTRLRRESMDGIALAVFEHEPEQIGGALVHGGPYRPGDTGTLIYLNAGPSLDRVLERVAGLGGAVVTGKTLITPEIGYFAHVRDTEGNVVGLHAQD